MKIDDLFLLRGTPSDQIRDRSNHVLFLRILCCRTTVTSIYRQVKSNQSRNSQRKSHPKINLVKACISWAAQMSYLLKTESISSMVRRLYLMSKPWKLSKSCWPKRMMPLRAWGLCPSGKMTKRTCFSMDSLPTWWSTTSMSRSLTKTTGNKWVK